jgi:hypothetical protein
MMYDELESLGRMLLWPILSYYQIIHSEGLKSVNGPISNIIISIIKSRCMT